jgi:hypothetical protein
MVATFGWVEYLTNATDTATPTNLNFGSTLAANLAPSTYPITAGTYSYEKWVKADFSGTFTRIDNIKFWKSAGAYVTGETINFTGEAETYAAPTTTASTYATGAVPTTEPGSANVSIGGSLSGSLTAAGDSDFIILQTSVTTAASAGAVNQKTFTLQYDEV